MGENSNYPEVKYLGNFISTAWIKTENYNYLGFGSSKNEKEFTSYFWICNHKFVEELSELAAQLLAKNVKSKSVKMLNEKTFLPKWTAKSQASFKHEWKTNWLLL